MVVWEYPFFMNNFDALREISSCFFLTVSSALTLPLASPSVDLLVDVLLGLICAPDHYFNWVADLLKYPHHVVFLARTKLSLLEGEWSQPAASADRKGCPYVAKGDD